MKRIIYLSTLGITIAVLLGCFGQPIYHESPSEFLPALISSNNQDIEFQKIGNTDNQLIGLWYAENNENNSYSRLRFKADRSFQEDIYSNLTKEYLASIRGTYQMENNHLTFTVTEAQQFCFAYHLTANLLKLSPIVKEN